ncbi:MAG: response regulator, partial [Omnitrophica bacterium]|nr:response regulator [Candidatus Omnitrophota bacterium]
MVKKPILVTDDERGVRDSFHMALKDSYNVLTADCARECLTIIKRSHPQLVVLDVRLPDMDGLTVLKEIKQINSSLPVIVITGAGTHKTAIEALKLGAVDFIAKPLNFYYVRAAIEHGLAYKLKRPEDLPSIEDVITRNYLSTLKTLNKILEAKDPCTREHSKRVSDYAVNIAQELGLSQDEQEVMRQTALLHDIGKVGIAEVILNKPAKLNAQEWAEIKRHSQIGEEFLEPLKMLHIEQSMIRHHHERYDGKGYPDHLKGEDIPLYARILAVADAYEAMTSERAYRRALTPIEALTELERCSGTQFDSKVVEVFVT